MPISYVGGTTSTFVGATNGTQTISLTALTGGSNTSPSIGDVVILAYATGSTADRSLTVSDAAYLDAATELYANGSTSDTNFHVWYKVLTAADTSVDVSKSGSNSDASAVAIKVFRGVDTSTPLGVAATTATGTGTGRPNPPSITPVDTGSWIVTCYGSAAATGAVYTSPADVTNFNSATSSDTTDAMVGMGTKTNWVSGAFDPAAISAGGTTGSGDSWAAVTLALKPLILTISAGLNGVGTISSSALMRTNIGAALIGAGTVASNTNIIPLSITSAEFIAWYDPTDITTLFTDTAGTVPVTADGDLVACVKDKSGNNLDLIQSTSTKRPIYRTGSGNPYLEFDGVDDSMTVGSNFSLTDASGQHSALAGIIFNNNTGIQSVIDADNFNASQRLSQLLRNNAGTAETIAFNNAVTPFTDSGLSITLGNKTVLSEITTTTTTEVFVGGTGNGFTAVSGTLFNTATKLSVGCSNFASANQFFAGQFYNGMVLKGALNSTDHSNLVTYVNSKLPGATTSNIASSLNGVGSLTASVLNIALASSTLGGAGTINGAITDVIPVGSLLNGAGTITGAIANILPIGSILAGSGSLSGSIFTIIPTNSLLNGIGNINATTIGFDLASVNLVGVGTLSSNISNVIPVSTILNGFGTIVAGIIGNVDTSAFLAGFGTLNGNISNIIPVSTVLNGSGLLTTNADQLDPVGALLSAAGSLTASIGMVAPVGASVAGTGTLASEILWTAIIASNLSGVGVIQAGISDVIPVNTSLGGFATLDGTISNIVPLAANLNGAGTESGNALETTLISAFLNGAGDLAVDAFDILPVGSAVNGTGIISCDAVINGAPVTYTIASALDGVGSLTGSVNQTLVISSAEQGAATLNAVAITIVSAGVSFNGASTINSNVFTIVPVNCIINGIGSVGATLSNIVPLSFNAFGSGQQISTISFVLTSDSVLVGTATLNGRINIIGSRRPIRNITWL